MMYVTFVLDRFSTGFSYKLDIAFAKCQRATIQKNTNWELKKQSCSVHVTFFVAKYSKQRQMS